MELGQVRAPVPVYGQLGQLVQGPVIPLVAAAELLNVEIGRHGVGVDVQALGKKVLALLGHSVPGGCRSGFPPGGCSPHRPGWPSRGCSGP